MPFTFVRYAAGVAAAATSASTSIRTTATSGNHLIRPPIGSTAVDLDTLTPHHPDLTRARLRGIYPHMLQDDYASCLAGNLRAAARMITREYDTALRPHDLRITQVA